MNGIDAESAESSTRARGGTADEIREHEQITPGTGRQVPPRSALRTDAAQLSLDGEWDFRWSPTPQTPLDITGTDISESRPWSTVRLPAHWGMPGGPGGNGPQYTNVVYPFPVDPPHVPDRNPTGDHRRVFDLPTDWPSAGSVHLRTEGIESFGHIWLNGHEVGTRQGSRLTHDFDVTDLLLPTDNVLLIRVTQWSAGSYLEDQDQWWLPGIFRSIALLHRPSGGIDDVWLDGDLAADGSGVLHAEITAPEQAYPITLRIPDLGLEHVVERPGPATVLPVGPVEPWTAETPRRYRAVLTAREERVEVTVGFRRISVDGGVLRVNGTRIILRGVNRHEWDPRTGRVIDLDSAREELLAMKRANIDAVRTAHYPPDARWLDLADEIGVWVMLECDLETHGFEGQGWARNPADDPAWHGACLDRIRRTVERDKNHPSIILWSLGNESATGTNLEAMGNWVHARDPRRPVHYEGDRTGAYTDVYARMYPALEEIHSWLSPGGPVAVAHHPASRITAREAARVRSMPLILVEYLHAMGTGPGGVADYAALVEQNERIAGGFVWEWKDHAVALETGSGTHWRYGGDFGETVHDGNFVIDGLADAECRPHPGLIHWAESVAPVRGRWEEPGKEGTGRLLVDSLRHFTTTDGLALHWQFDVDGHAVASGRAPLGGLAPAAIHELPVPHELAAALAETRDAHAEAFLLLEIQLDAPMPWAGPGHVVSRRQHPVRAPSRALATAAPERSQPVTAIEAQRGAKAGFVAADGHFRWDRRGYLRVLGEFALEEAGVDLWRAPTDNDEGHGPLDYEAADPRLTLGAGGGARGPSSADRWRQRGLDRLVTRTRSVTADDGRLVVARRLAPGGDALNVDTRLTWSVVKAGATGENALDCLVEVEAGEGWEGTWPRVGLHLALPAGPDADGWEAQWFGHGPLESWPDLRVASWVGRHRRPLSRLHHPRARPQITGHRSGLRELTLYRPDGAAFRVRTLSGTPGFTVSPWEAPQMQVPHHDQLPPSQIWHVHLDLAQHGVGTRSCGPDVRPEHQLRPGRFEATFRFSASPAC